MSNNNIFENIRNIEGYPIGENEDILRLADIPNYLPVPNPYVQQYLRMNATNSNDEYKISPFAWDVSEGKNDPVYNAHSYHTKVPYKAIMRYILHYTQPGDVVFDGFCGSGMTGVAAQRCGYPENDFRLEIESSGNHVQWGERKAVLNDLAPIATFIAYNYTTPIDIVKFEEIANNILKECKKECDWLYQTYHYIQDNEYNNDLLGGIKGTINYIVWSDVFLCPHCNHEFIHWDVFVDEITQEEIKSSLCPECRLEISMKNIIRSTESILDKKLNKVVNHVKQEPVLIKYTYGKKQYKKRPDKYDYEIIDRIKEIDNAYWYPIDELPIGYNTEQPKKSHGINYVHEFYTQRNLYVLSSIFDKISKVDDKRIRNHLIFWFTSIYSRSHKLNRYMPNHDRHVGPLSGTLYIPYFQAEINILNLLEDKLKSILKAGSPLGESCITTQSITDLKNIPENTIDYIFTDPPFGDNLNYSELSFIWEAWLKVKTNNIPEAIINVAQNKGLKEYEDLMSKAFAEYFRVLKPNRWITIEFHNSKNAVWNAISAALWKAGFIVADVRVLDKQKGTTKQLSYTTAVKQDLVISAYKPQEQFSQKFLEDAGTTQGVWEFIDQYLEKLPIVVKTNGGIDRIQQRQKYLLYDTMLAYHIQKGLYIPLDAAEFYSQLEERYVKRDDMYFLVDQVNIYDEARNVEDLIVQLSYIITSEKDAIGFLIQELSVPQTYQEIQPKFIKILKQLKYEDMPELLEILEDNFLKDENGKYYIPDSTKQVDIDRLKEKKLLKQFSGYVEGKGKLKNARIESIQAGFKKAWKEKDFETIVKVGNRLPDSIILEDQKLFMYYDNAKLQVEE